MSDVDMFTGASSIPSPVSAGPRTLPGHKCSCCATWTRRRIRHYPTLGYADDRCARCTNKGYKPGVAVAEQKGERWAP